MAPNKKKKKPAVNPARGFATTSMPSKAKPSPALSEDVSPERAAVRADEGQFGTPDAVATEVGQAAEQKLQDLSPEELEKHLEASELQNIVEQHGQKSLKDAARQVMKLETERRTLRPQAANLYTNQWLPSELMEQIIDITKAGGFWMSGTPANANKVEKQLSDEDLCVKLWTLRRALLKLNFSQSDVQQALRYVLDIHRNRPISAGRESLWGLEESLEWLAIHVDPENLADYDSKRSDFASRGVTTPSALGSQSATPDLSPATSGAATPIRGLRTQTQVALKGDSDSDASSIPKRTAAPFIYSSEDSDEDLLPENFVEEYLKVKTLLFEIQPNLSEQLPARSKVGRSADGPVVTQSDPKIARLQGKLAKIERDVLFDCQEADFQWNKKLNELRKQAAEQRRFDAIVNRPRLDVRDEKPRAESKESGSEKNLNGVDSEDGSVFGDIFDATEGDESEPTLVQEERTTVQLRDFGEWTGPSPRRLLEEMCKAKDAGCKLSYRLVSSASHANRHAITIKWSKYQDFAAPIALPMISYASDPTTTSVAMISLATPTSIQSEACLSTIVLFALFPKEKAYLRLPSIWREYWNELVKLKATEMDASDRDVLRELRKLMNDKAENEEEDDGDVVLTKNFAQRNKRGGAPSPHDRESLLANSVENLKALWDRKSATAAYRNMLQSRSNLPIWASKDEIVRAITERQAVIVCSETGSGKSTQVPSFILEHELMSGRHCKIYVTEPRRISAITLARRVSEELGEYKNDVGTARSLVGYAIRLESRMTRSTRLVFATTGVVVRMLERPNDLSDVTHIVLDEVHERSIDSDFLLIVLRRLMHQRPDLKVVLMSATVDARKFSSYLDGAPILNISGRTFPVEVNYLEDAIELTGYTIDGSYGDGEVGDSDGSSEDETKRSDAAALAGYSDRTRRTVSNFNEYRLDYQLITKTLVAIAIKSQLQDYSKAILIFMPGLAEIRRLSDEISSHPIFARGWQTHLLHSTISSEDQERAFLIPPSGTRKIVIATNIAETGITIPDITAVIDAGKEKVMRFDERRQLSKLVESFISRANAKQRRGRAGRVQPGICFHLFTKERHDRLLAENQTPEMLRLSLQDLVLRVKICNLGGIEQTLSEALDPPTTKNIRRAVTALKDVKALTASEDLTPLGRQLARLPLDVFLGKLTLNGIFFRCLDVSVTIAAILSSKSSFVAPIGSQSSADLARLSFRKGDSDPLTSYNAYLAWKRIRTNPTANITEYQFCRKNFLSTQTLSSIEDLKVQLLVSLADTSLLQLSPDENALLAKSRVSGANPRNRTFFTIPSRFDENVSNDVLVSAVIAYSFYPKLLVRDGKGWRNVANNQSVTLAPTSVNRRPQDGLPTPSYLSFYHIMQSTKARSLNAHETTSVEDMAVVLGCGDAEFRMWAGVVVIDGGKLRFRVRDWKTMVALKVLREGIREGQGWWFRGNGKTGSGSSGPAKAVGKWLDFLREILEGKSKQKKEISR